jgi:hypothetical protein
MEAPWWMNVSTTNEMKLFRGRPDRTGVSYLVIWDGNPKRRELVAAEKYSSRSHLVSGIRILNMTSPTQNVINHEEGRKDDTPTSKAFLHSKKEGERI